MKRLLFYIGLIVPAGLALSGCATELTTSPDAQPPNVILVLTDDQGYGDLSCHGNPILKTPNMDRLYAQSVRLTDFHVDPCCSPTRAALLSGQYSDRTGVWHTILGRSIMRTGTPTLADLFGRAGYRTALFGKWHLGDNYPYRPQDRGFDEVLEFGAGAIGNMPDYWRNDYFDDTYHRNGKPESQQGYCNDIWFDEAIRFARDNRNRPFFCMVATNLPHYPFFAPQELIDRFKTVTDDQKLRAYYACLASIDDNLGKLMAALEQQGLARNTILIFMSDNGADPWVGPIRTDDNHFVTSGYNAGMRGGKISEYEGGHRVPCFVRWPAGGIAGGRDVDQLTAHFDWMPTLIEACGLDKPRKTPLDGRSLLPLLQGKATNWPDRTVFVHNQRVDFPVKGKNYQAMTGRWRMVNGAELYDIKADPGQKHDVAAAHPQVMKQLRTEYDRWWASLHPAHQQYTVIPVGDPDANPTRLTAHDWHGAPCWDQSHAKRGALRTGTWVIDVVRDGEYAVELRRFPPEADLPIQGGGEAGQKRAVSQAELKIGQLTTVKMLGESVTVVRFHVGLRKGVTCLSATFSDGGEINMGAFYVTLERTRDASQKDLERYRPSDPDKVVRPPKTE